MHERNQIDLIWSNILSYGPENDNLRMQKRIHVIVCDTINRNIKISLLILHIYEHACRESN